MGLTLYLPAAQSLNKQAPDAGINPIDPTLVGVLNASHPMSTQGPDVPRGHAYHASQQQNSTRGHGKMPARIHVAPGFLVVVATSEHTQSVLLLPMLLIHI